jgi:hypothetical protein
MAFLKAPPRASRPQRVVGYCAGLPVTASPHFFLFLRWNSIFDSRPRLAGCKSVKTPGWESFDKHLIFKPGPGRSTVSSGLFCFRQVPYGPVVKSVTVPVFALCQNPGPE